MPESEYNASLSGLSFVTDDIQGLGDLLLHWLADSTHRGTSTAPNRLLSYINPHVYNLSMLHPEVRQCLNQSDRVCIDGIGIKLALFLKLRQNLPRVVAEHLFNDFVRRLSTPVNAIMVGVTSEEATAAAQSLTQRNPNLMFTSTLDGFADDATYCEFFQQHVTIPLVLIGAGTPRSEQIALMAAQWCRGSVVFHIGAGTIKTWAGTKKCGPAVMSRLGLEWLHRIVYEPHTRTRYTVGAVEFARNLITRRNTPAHHTNNGDNT